MLWIYSLNATFRPFILTSSCFLDSFINIQFESFYKMHSRHNLFLLSFILHIMLSLHCMVWGLWKKINCANDNEKYMMLIGYFVNLFEFYVYKRIQEAWGSPNKQTKRCDCRKKFIIVWSLIPGFSCWFKLDPR